MALEQDIQSLTEAIKALTVVINTVGNPFPQGGAAAEGGPATAATKPRGPGRPTKEETEAKKKLAEANAAGAKIAETGDPVGTTYFHNAEHNTVFSVKFGEKNDLPGVEITPADFVAKRTAIAAAQGQTTAAADPFATTTSAAADPFAMASAPPPPPPKPKTLEEVIAKLKEVSAKHGMEAVTKGLAKYGTTNVGGLTGKDMNEVHATFQKLLDTGNV